MVNQRPSVIPTGKYTKSETARALGVDRHTVTRYASMGLLKFYSPPIGRAQLTTGAQIIRCWESFRTLKISKRQ